MVTRSPSLDKSIPPAVCCRQRYGWSPIRLSSQGPTASALLRQTHPAAGLYLLESV